MFSHLCINTPVCTLIPRQNVDLYSVPILCKPVYWDSLGHSFVFDFTSSPSPSVYPPIWFLVFDSCSVFDYSLACRTVLRISACLVNELCLNKQRLLHLPWSASGSFIRRNPELNPTELLWGHLNTDKVKLLPDPWAAPSQLCTASVGCSLISTKPIMHCFCGLLPDPWAAPSQLCTASVGCSLIPEQHQANTVILH